MYRDEQTGQFFKAPYDFRVDESYLDLPDPPDNIDLWMELEPSQRRRVSERFERGIAINDEAITKIYEHAVDVSVARSLEPRRTPKGRRQ